MHRDLFGAWVGGICAFRRRELGIGASNDAGLLFLWLLFRAERAGLSEVNNIDDPQVVLWRVRLVSR